MRIFVRFGSELNAFVDAALDSSLSLSSFSRLGNHLSVAVAGVFRGDNFYFRPWCYKRQ